MAGAEPWSAPGGPRGVLVVHGFTGTPQSMRGLAHAFAAAGFAVELPLLPGHGTTVEDLMATGWDDWTTAVETTYEELARRCAEVVVAGMSMGGALAVWLATRQPAIRGVIAINPVAEPATPEMRELVEGLEASGTTTIPGIGNDVADPDQTELAYDLTPVAPARSMYEGVEAMQEAIAGAAMPLLLMNAPQDHTLSASNSDHLATIWGGPVERISLERSYHVATLDFDRQLIEDEALAFAERVCGS